MVAHELNPKVTKKIYFFSKSKTETLGLVSLNPCLHLNISKFFDLLILSLKAMLKITDQRASFIKVVFLVALQNREKMRVEDEVLVCYCRPAKQLPPSYLPLMATSSLRRFSRAWRTEACVVKFKQVLA